MKTKTTFLAASFLAAAASTQALQLGTNITISDGNYSGSGWYSDREDQETETNPNTITNQVWDLEGMFLDGTTLTLVGGYDFLNGVTYNKHVYAGGDLFIDVDGDALFGTPQNTGTTGGYTTNLFGYDYVFDLDVRGGTFSLVQLGEGSTVFRGTDVSSSNPWSYRDGGTVLAANLGLTYLSGLSDADVGGLLGDKHYALQFDLSDLAPYITSGTYTLHYTMECGNDNLMGRTSVNVPEASSTAALLGFGLFGLVGLRRRFWR